MPLCNSKTTSTYDLAVMPGKTDGECLPTAAAHGSHRPVQSHERPGFPAEGTTFLL